MFFCCCFFSISKLYALFLFAKSGTVHQVDALMRHLEGGSEVEAISLLPLIVYVGSLVVEV